MPKFFSRLLLSALFAFAFVGKAAAAVPAITSSGTATGQVGVAFSYQITANNVPTSFGDRKSVV